MSMSTIEKLMTNNYKVLKLIYDNQVKMTNGSVFTPMTQVEIANQIGVSTITMNAIFKEMLEDDLLYKYGNKRGRYCLSEKAIYIITKIDEINQGIKEFY